MEFHQTNNVAEFVANMSPLHREISVCTPSQYVMLEATGRGNGWKKRRLGCVEPVSLGSHHKIEQTGWGSLWVVNNHEADRAAYAGTFLHTSFPPHLAISAQMLLSLHFQKPRVKCRKL